MGMQKKGMWNKRPSVNSLIACESQVPAKQKAILSRTTVFGADDRCMQMSTGRFRAQKKKKKGTPVTPETLCAKCGSGNLGSPTSVSVESPAPSDV